MFGWLNSPDMQANHKLLFQVFLKRKEKEEKKKIAWHVLWQCSSRFLSNLAGSGESFSFFYVIFFVTFFSKMLNKSNDGLH
jgi:hypothetical protein